MPKKPDYDPERIYEYDTGLPFKESIKALQKDPYLGNLNERLSQEPIRIKEFYKKPGTKKTS